MLCRLLLQLTPIFSANKDIAHLFVAVCLPMCALRFDQESSSLRSRQ